MLDFSGFTILAKRMNCSMALSARAAELCDWYPLSSPRSTVPTVNNRRNVSIYDPDCGRDLVKETQYFPDGTVWRKLCRACIHGTREPGSADKCLVEEMCALGNGWQCLCNGTDIVASEVDMTCTSIPAGEVSAVTLHPAIRSVDVTAITAIDLGDLRRMALSNLSTSFPVIKMVRISGLDFRIPCTDSSTKTLCSTIPARVPAMYLPSIRSHCAGYHVVDPHLRSRRRPTRPMTVLRLLSPPQPVHA